MSLNFVTRKLKTQKLEEDQEEDKVVQSDIVSTIGKKRENARKMVAERLQDRHFESPFSFRFKTFLIGAKINYAVN